MTKNKPLTNKERKALISAWAKLQIVCAYLSDKNKNYYFTKKYDPYQDVEKVLNNLDLVVSNLFAEITYDK